MSNLDETRPRPSAQEESDAALISEQTPLIPRSIPSSIHDDEQAQSKASRRRWPSLLALLILCIVAIFIIIFAFVAPSAVEQYANEAVVFEPTSLSIDSFTTTGVRARVQGDFSLDPERVKQKSVRDIGKFCTWIARAVESGESEVQVSLPEYGNVVLGTASVPPIVVDIQPGHITHVDFLADLAPGDVDGIRRIAKDWIDGRLGQLRVLGKANVPIKSGIFSLGKQTVLHELLFDNKDIPEIPAYDIKKLNFREIEAPEGQVMVADVALSVENPYPIDFVTPALDFEILVAGCEKKDPFIRVAHASVADTHIVPDSKVEVNAAGLIRELPPVLTQDCPDTSKSPLDNLLGRYIHGKDNTIYVQGSGSTSSNTPKWIGDLISDIVVPVPVPGHTLGHLMKNFSLADTRFSLPDPFAEPDTPESNPRISAKVQAYVALPEEMNFNMSVTRVRADTDVYYKGKKLGILDFRKWQPASSKRVESKNEAPTLMIQSEVKNAPLIISDEDLFTDVIQELLFGGRGVVMHIKAEVDASVETALGAFTIRKIPAEGKVPVKPISSTPNKPVHDGPNLPAGLKARLSDLRVDNTTPSSLTLGASIDMTNPTEYSASVPYVNIHIIKNGSILGHATARNLEVTTGKNTNLTVSALWDPLTLSGEQGHSIGRELLSQYISGYNITISVRTHNASFPNQPWLGHALSKFTFDLPAPPLGLPPSSTLTTATDDNEDEDTESPHFITDATFHLFSSTATFLLLSPLAHTTLYITSLNATALYHSSPMGSIIFPVPDDNSWDPDSEEMPVPPVAETPDGKGYATPALPVQWDLGSVGYRAVREALGGRLRLAAEAVVGVRIGEWRERVWFKGVGIGARVRW